jgi:hypothetical protein
MNSNAKGYAMPFKKCVAHCKTAVALAFSEIVFVWLFSIK